MCDGLGLCGAADEAARAQFAANHEFWIALAAELGCHSLRVNAIGEGDKDEQAKRCADGLAKLVAVAKPSGISVIVENHGGLSSNGEWLAKVKREKLAEVLHDYSDEPLAEEIAAALAGFALRGAAIRFVPVED